MTREEAIKRLREYSQYAYGVYHNEQKDEEAFDMAIEALQVKPINCNYTCSDCVHRNKAYEEEPCHSCFNNDGAGYKPVIYGEWADENCRCPVCKHWIGNIYKYKYCPDCGSKMDKGGETK